MASSVISSDLVFFMLRLINKSIIITKGGVLVAKYI